jgi:hypothetical protein
MQGEEHCLEAVNLLGQAGTGEQPVVIPQVQHMVADGLEDIDHVRKRLRTDLYGVARTTKKQPALYC